MPRWAWVVIIVVGIPVALLMAVGMSGAYRAFSIPSGAMSPTLLAGDKIYAWTLRYGPPEQGDVAIFIRPDTGEDYIKRVIGMPGDRVQMRQGVLHINDQVVPRERVDDFLDSRSGREVAVAHYLETLPNGRQHYILERLGDTGMLDETRVFTVPDGHYFMLGDNRDDSLDSRAGVGFVPMENFIGRAEFIWWARDLSRVFTGVE